MEKHWIFSIDLTHFLNCFLLSNDNFSWSCEHFSWYTIILQFFSKEKTDWVFSQVKRKINSYLSVQRQKKRWLFSLRQQIDTNLLIKPHQTQKLAQISDSKTSNNDNVYVPFCSNKNRLPLHSTCSGNAPETTNMVWRNSANVWTDQYGVYHLSLALYLMTLTAPLLLWYVFPVTISKSSNKIDPSVNRLIIVVQICKKLP